MKHRDHIDRLKAALLDSAGASPPDMRRAIFERRLNDVPEALRSYLDTVQRHAHRVTDADVDALKAAGYSEDFIFEITGSAALGAAMLRMERAMAVLEEAES